MFVLSHPQAVQANGKLLLAILCLLQLLPVFFSQSSLPLVHWANDNMESSGGESLDIFL